MTHRVSEDLLSRLADFLSERMGLSFPRERWRDLERGVGSMAREMGLEGAEPCIRWLLASELARGQIETLASHLTVGETYFFREKKTFEVLEEHILPELLRARGEAGRRLRIWSAGCATGPEPYSIAILLQKKLTVLKDWNVTILATDINPRFLRHAAEGVFNDWAFRDGSEWVRDVYFEKATNHRVKILPSLRQMVTFSYLNLAEDVYPSLVNETNAMDIIFCRNVLMYFTPQAAEKVVERFHRCLVEGGWLIVSPCETSHVLFSRFATVNFPGVILYRKTAQRREVFEAPPLTGIEELSLPSPEPWGPVVELDTVPGEPAVRVEEPSRYETAMGLYEQGRYSEAELQLTELLGEEPDCSNALALLARVHANRGRLAEALESCEKAIAAEKLQANSHYLRANILVEQGALEEARASLKRVLYLDPEFVLGHFALGSLALRQGKSSEAEKHFENARLLAGARPAGEVLPESEGITAGRLMEIIAMVRQQQCRPDKSGAALEG